MRMPRKKKVFRKSFSGMEKKIFFIENANSVWLNNQAFLMQYVVAKILWLKLRYIGYIQVAPFHLFGWTSIFEPNIATTTTISIIIIITMIRRSTTSCTRRAAPMEARLEAFQTALRSLTDHQQEQPLFLSFCLWKEKPLVFLSFCIVTGNCSHFRNLFPFDILETFSCKICPHTRYWRSPQARKGWELSQMKITEY